MKRLWQEKSYPYILGVLAGICLFFFLPDNGVNKSIRDLPNPLLTVTAISLGFIGTTQAILMSIAGSRIIRTLSKPDQSGKSYIDDLHGYVGQATWLAILATVLATLAILIPLEEASIKRSYLAIWLSVTVTAFCAFIRVVTVMSSLLKKVPGNTTPGG